MRITAYHALTRLSKLCKVRAVSSVMNLGVHMKTSELESMINDGAVTDETIFEALKVVVADKFDADNKYLPPTEAEMDDIGKLYDLLMQARPMVMDMHGAYIVNQLGSSHDVRPTLQ